VYSRMLWVLLIGLALALLVLVVRHDDGTIAGLASGDFASLAIKMSLLVFFGGAILAMFRYRFAEAIQAALFWVVLVLLLAAGYSYRMELREVADRVVAEFVPGHAAVRGMTVEIARGRTGGFQISAMVNGGQVPMLLDTGATMVVLTQEAAKAAGLPLEVLSYSIAIETANGRARAASVVLDRVTIGSIVERSVPALIAQPGQLRTNLLGMSFLNRLQSWEVRDDRLVLRGS
jgi:aspartyl protease family protein